MWARGAQAAALAGQAGAAGARAASSSTAAAASSADTLRAAFGYCVSQVRAQDYENYVWVVQLPKELRASVMALRAFNVETALIADAARSEPLVLMRCQWWRDAVNACYKGAAPDQPVITALAEVLRQGVQLTRYRLQRVINTREEDLLRGGPPPTLAALEAYAEGTAGQLLQLQLEAAGVGGEAADHAALHLGKAVGVANLLRGTAHHAARRRVYLPADLCAAHGVAPEDVLAGRDSDGLRDVVLSVASAAKGHLDEARRLAPEVPPAARPLLLPAVSCGKYLAALERSGFSLFDQQLLRGGGYSQLAYQLQIKWSLLRGTY